MSLRIDKIIRPEDLKDNDIIVIKFTRDFENFEQMHLISKSLNTKLKNTVIALREDMRLEIVDEATMNKLGWFRQKQIKDK